MTRLLADGGQHDFSASAERYDRVLSTVEHNTGDPQLPGCTPRTVRKILAADGPYDGDDVQSSIEKAVADGDLLRWDDHSGTTRLTCTTEDDLEKLIGWQNTKDNPQTKLIERAVDYLSGGED